MLTAVQPRLSYFAGVNRPSFVELLGCETSSKLAGALLDPLLQQQPRLHMHGHVAQDRQYVQFPSVGDLLPKTIAHRKPCQFT